MNSFIFNSNRLILQISLVFGFSLIFLVIYLSFSEILLRTKVVPNDFFFKQKDLYESDQSADIVAFGDSHLSQGFIPDNNSLNMAYAGESFEQLSIKLNYFLSSHPKPKLIILQLSPHMFADYRYSDKRRNYHKIFGQDKSAFDNFYLSDPILKSQLLHYWKMFFLNKDFKHNGYFHERGSVLINYTSRVPNNAEDLLQVKKRVYLHTARDNPFEGNTDEKIIELLELLKSYEIEVCAVSLPVTPLYRELSSGFDQFSEIYNFFSSATENLHIQYFNHSNLFDDYSLFRNEDHLNTEGAKIFTKQLYQDCTKHFINSF